MTIPILIGIGAILLLVGFHEFGHFLAAKLLGMGVEEFAIGFGPAVFAFRRKETRYSLRLFPLGGFVRLAGEGPGATEFPPGRTYYGRPAWVRFLVCLAGPVGNVLLAFAFALAAFLGVGLPRTRVAGLVPGKPAEKVLELGDVVLAVGGRSVWTGGEIGPTIQELAPAPVPFDIVRDGQVLRLEIPPEFSPEDVRYLVGAHFRPQVQLTEVKGLTALSDLSAAGLRPGDRILAACGAQVRSLAELHDRLEEGCRELLLGRAGESFALGLPDLPAGEALDYLLSQAEFVALPIVYGRPPVSLALDLAGRQVAGAMVVIGATIRALLAREIPAGEAVTGPVGIAALISQWVSLGPLFVLLLLSVISVNVGLFNLLPFPPLDGARMVFALYEMVFRRRVSPRIETAIHTAGFVLFFALLILITFRDILRLFG